MPTPLTTTCNTCGAPIDPGARYCAGCGADVSGQQGNVATAYVPRADPRPTVTPSQLDGLRHATLGEYDIQGELGRGGMATVYLAHDVALDRKVALKVMSPHLLSGEGMVERFKREARTAASLSHPNIIPIYAVRESESIVYFVMKFVEGRPLDSIIKEVGPLPIAMVQTILQQVGSALGYAHRRGIIHRDIKPANIMVDTDGWAVVTDFGIAKVTEAKGLTMTGATVGTPSYMSPEQCAAKELTGASDQYSLGIVAYEMLAGKLPFVAESVMAIMYAHFNEPPPPINDLRKDTPPELAAALMQMLEKEPEKRFPDIDAATAAIGGAPLPHDDPIRTRMMTLAATGMNLQKMKRLSTPVSPTPAARTPGKATAAATKGAGGTAQATRGVPFAVRPPQVTVAVGGAVQLTAHRKSVGGRTLPGTEVSWASTEPDIASVSAEGLVTALAPGSAVITCAAEGASATATITVRADVRRGGGLFWKLVGAATVAGIGVVVYLFGPWSAHQGTNLNPAGSRVTAADSVRSFAPGPVDSSSRSGGSQTPTTQVPPPIANRPADRGTARPGRPTDGRDARREAALAVARNDSLVRELRQSAAASRTRAVAAGATAADLAAGDAERQEAEGLVTQGKVADAVARMSSAIGLWTGAEQTARARATAAPQGPAPVPPRAETPAPAPADPRPLIDAAIQAYARAIESRDVNAVRRAYPGVTAQQLQTWKDFFAAVRDLRVDLRASRISPNGDSAEANVQGSFSFLQDRRSQIQPVQFRASLERGEGGWRITAIQ